MTTEMVDWDLAVSLGSRLAGAGPAGDRRRRRPRRSPSCARAPTGRRRTSASSPASTPASARRRSSSSTGRPGSRPTPTGSPRPRARSSTSSTEKKGPPGPVTQAVGSRITGAEVGGLLGFMAEQGARPVRPVPRPARPAAAGRAQRRARRARARRRPHGLPALGLPARGDPPRAVHRGAVDARPPLRARSRALAETVEPQRLLDDGLKRIAEAIKRRPAAAACSTCSARPSRRRSSTGSPA